MTANRDEPLALGPTVGAALSEALPGFFRTFWALVPFCAAGLVATVGVMVVITIAVVALIAVMAYAGNSAAIPATIVYTTVVFSVIPAVVVVSSPFYVGMARGLWRHLRDDVDLGVSDGIAGAFRRLDLLIFVVVFQILTVAGYLCFVVPGLLLDSMLGFVIAGVIVHDLPLGKAIGRSVRHFLSAPMWHLGLTLVESILALAISSLIPLLGSAIATSLHLQLTFRAYTEVFPAEPPPTEPAPAQPEMT